MGLFLASTMITSVLLKKLTSSNLIFLREMLFGTKKLSKLQKIGASSASTFATLLRMTRSTMLEVIRQDYIRTAKAKGQSEFKIVISHAFRNALVPIITTIGIQICGFLAGSVLVESVFALPGLGKYVVDSVNYKDYPAVQGVVLFIAINCVIINLLTDIIYCFVDPRIKAQYGRKKGVKFSQKEAAQHG